MAHYVAIIEDNGPDDVSLWFPDLPGCMSGGDDIEEALENAPEAIAFYAEEQAENGRELSLRRGPWTNSGPIRNLPTRSGTTPPS